MNIFILIFFTLLAFKSYSQILLPQAGEGFNFNSNNCQCLSEERRQKIIAENKSVISELIKQGGTLKKSETIKFIWPIRAANSLTDYSFYGISNFVDHDSSYPNHLLDYNNGTRTYDTESGYNHQGTDIFTWPFSWYKMDNNQVEVVAAADGVIIGKHDGNFDRSCAMNDNDWNAVYLQHSDGSITWYGHFKNHSLTDKNIGDTVTAGEFLGIVGSSGSSTGPHLHFEVYDKNMNLIDPWFGPANPSVASSLWQNQKPYFDPKINKVSTHSAWPVFPSCPQEEIPNLKNNFVSNDTVYFVTFYQDQIKGMVSSYKIYTPDNLIWKEWNHSITDSFYTASWWGWWWILPSNASQGNWKFDVVFNGVEYYHIFHVNENTTVKENKSLPSEFFVSNNYPNPFNPSTKLQYEIPNDNFVSIKLYDILGEEVKTIENDYKHAGSYELTINAGGLESGVYLLSFISGSFRASKKILLIK